MSDPRSRTNDVFDTTALDESVSELLNDLRDVDVDSIPHDEIIARLVSTLDRVEHTMDMAERFRRTIKAQINRLQNSAAENPPTCTTKDDYAITISHCNAKLQELGVSPAFLLCADSVIYDTARLAQGRDEAFYDTFSNIMSTKAHAMQSLMELEAADRNLRAAAGPPIPAAVPVPTAPVLGDDTDDDDF